MKVSVSEEGKILSPGRHKSWGFNYENQRKTKGNQIRADFTLSTFKWEKKEKTMRENQNQQTIATLWPFDILKNPINPRISREINLVKSLS